VSSETLLVGANIEFFLIFFRVLSIYYYMLWACVMYMYFLFIYPSVGSHSFVLPMVHCDSIVKHGISMERIRRLMIRSTSIWLLIDSMQMTSSWATTDVCRTWMQFAYSRFQLDCFRVAPTISKELTECLRTSLAVKSASWLTTITSAA